MILKGACAILVALAACQNLFALELEPGKVAELAFTNTEVPPTLYSLIKKKPSPARLVVRLPNDYTASRPFPLLVYLRGRDGGPAGDIEGGLKIVGTNGWIVASLPLFKQTLDRSEPFQGEIVGFDDAPVLARAYRVMLGKLFQEIPNIDSRKSAMAGFSNGAITIAVLLSCQDPTLLQHFGSFVMVDQGMCHLTGLYKRPFRDCRILMLVGDQSQGPGDGRQILLKQADILSETALLFGANFTCKRMKDTGHAFPDSFRALTRNWLESPAPGSPAPVPQKP